MIKTIKELLQRNVKVSKDPKLSVDSVNLLSGIFECNTLKSKNEIISATRLTEFLGFHPHLDPQKNWDTLKCMFYLLRECTPGMPILDAGGSPDSSVLNSLSNFGYNELFACDIVDMTMYAKVKNSKVKFSVQNIENTNYQDDFFRAVLSLSVIEHGINIEKFFQEMNRILKKNGLLLITTDFWDDYINCDGIYPYGPGQSQMKVFQKMEIEDICNKASVNGFTLCDKLDTKTMEKAVRWEAVNREYTFIFLAFRKN
ncbi:MAG: class I SAM-dependent methyltransferase [Bacteroidetes bacterium]|nr:MAG: class I SAM-dependent methyltransferase [Bacteroidota bacterium]